MTDEGDRAERDGAVDPRSRSRYTTELPTVERLRHMLDVRSHLAPLDPPHPALRATFPREGGRGSLSARFTRAPRGFSRAPVRAGRLRRSVLPAAATARRSSAAGYGNAGGTRPVRPRSR